jgi:hypothetical protein
MKPRHVRLTFIIAAAAFSICWVSAGVADQSVLGAMQSFQEFCLSGDLSIEAIANVAKERHYELVVDRRFPGPVASTIVHKTWQVADSTGDFVLTATQSEGSRSGRSFQCGVTLPRGTETHVESALQEPSHFGKPDEINVNADGSRVVRWRKHFEWGTAEVDLTHRLPSLKGNSMINVLYRTAPK